MLGITALVSRTTTVAGFAAQVEIAMCARRGQSASPRSLGSEPFFSVKAQGNTAGAAGWFAISLDASACTPPFGEDLHGLGRVGARFLVGWLPKDRARARWDEVDGRLEPTSFRWCPETLSEGPQQVPTLACAASCERGKNTRPRLLCGRQGLPDPSPCSSPVEGRTALACISRGERCARAKGTGGSVERLGCTGHLTLEERGERL